MIVCLNIVNTKLSKLAAVLHNLPYTGLDNEK